MTGQEVVEHHRKWRKAKAEAIWSERRRVRDTVREAQVKCGKSFGFNVNSIVRDNIKHTHRYDFFKPTLRNFKQAADAHMAHANSDWASRDTEYYSACGYDDYQGEVRDAARETAKEYYLAVAYLRSK